MSTRSSSLPGFLMSLLGSILLILLSSTAVAQQDFIQNGGFEQPQIPPPFKTVTAGQSTIPGWTVVAGSVDIVRIVDNQVLDLNGNGPGAIAQTISALLGPATLSFTRTRGDSTQMQVMWNDAVLKTISDDTGTSQVTETFTVVGTGNDVLTFRSLSGSTGGFYLDDVAVTSCGQGSPQFLVHPESLVIGPGDTACFSARVVGECPMTFQWYHNGLPIEGATQARLCISGADSSDSGEYFVQATNSKGKTSSKTVTLEVGVLIVLADGERLLSGSTVRRPNSSKVTMTTTLSGGLILYTTDGSEPGLFSERYSEPLTITSPTVIRAVTYTADLLQSFEAGPFEVEVLPAYALTTKASGAGSIGRSPDKLLYFADDIVTLRAFPGQGWRFVEWMGDASGGSPEATLLIDGPKSVTAVFAELPRLTAQIGGEGTIAVTPQKPYYELGEQVQIAVVPRDGWYLRSWIGDAAGNSPRIMVTMDGHKNVTAILDPVPKFVLRTFTAGGGVIEGNTQDRYLDGSTVKLRAIPFTGWQFIEWKGDASGVAPETDVKMDGTKSVEAVFGTSISTSTIGGGHVNLSPAEGPYPFGSEVLVSAIGDPGNALALWAGAVSGSLTPLVFKVTAANPLISAAFAPKPAGQKLLAVHVMGGGAVTIDPARNLFEPGETVTVTAKPNAAWAFAGWTGDAVGADTALNLTMNADKTLTATFVSGVRLDAKIEGHGTIERLPDLPSYRPGEKVRLTAIPGSRWAFERWEGDVVGTDNPIWIVMDGSKSVSALLRASPGAQRWCLDGYYSAAPAIGIDGSVLTCGGDVKALDGRTGTLRWRSDAVPGGLRIVSVARDGTVCVVAENGVDVLDLEENIWEFMQKFQLNLIDGLTGTCKWKCDWKQYAACDNCWPSPCASPAAFTSSGTACFASQVESNRAGVGHDVQVYQFDGLLGTIHTMSSTYTDTVDNCAHEIPAPAVGTDGTVYVRFPLQITYSALGPNPWTFSLDHTWPCRAMLTSPAIGVDGRVYVGASDYSLYVLDGRTGTKQWSFVTGGPVTSSPAIGSDGTVYVGSDDGKLYALDGWTGAKRWEFATGGPVRSTPAITADGKVYFGSGDGKLYALDATTGALEWDFQTSGPVYSSPAVGNDGTIYVGSDDGKLYALVGSAALAESPWPMFMHDPQHTGSAEPRATNHAPILAPISDIVAKDGENLVIECCASDADMPMERLTWSLVQSPPGARISNYSGVIRWIPSDADKGRTFDFTVRVTDFGLPPLRDEQSFRVSVLDPERTLVNTPNPPQPGSPGAEWNLFSGPEPGGRPGILEYLYGQGNFVRVLDSKDLYWFVDPGPEGQLELLAVYSETGQGLQTANLDGSQVSETIVGGPPGIPETPTRMGITSSFTPVASPFLWAADAFPTGKWFSDPLLNGADADRDHFVTFRVTGYLSTPGDPSTFTPFSRPVYVLAFEDAADGDYDFNDLVVELHGVRPGRLNQAPVLDAIADQVVDELSQFTMTPTVTDPDLPEQSLSFTLATAPDGAAIDPQTGKISWTPGELDGPGTVSFVVTVTDDGVPPLSDSKSFQVTVNEVNSVPLIDPIADIGIKPWQRLEISCHAVDTDVPSNSLLWSLVEAPPGAVIDAQSGQLTWTPTKDQAGEVHLFRVRVTDNGTPPLSDEKTFSVTVEPITIEDATGIQWSLVSTPFTGRLWGVEYGGGMFVAVGANGTVLTSPDGITWIQRSTPTTETLWGLKYGCGRFVVAGHNGVILTSTNGIDWETSASGVAAHLTDVAFAGETCVVVGNFNTILTSHCGEGPWILRPVATTNHFQDVTFGGGHFVASGTLGLIAASADGTNWTVQDSGTTNGVPTTAYGNGVWVVAGAGGIVLRSTNLVQWDQMVPVPLAEPNGHLAGGSFANGRLVLVGGVRSGMTGGVVLVSTNGSDWMLEDAGDFPMLYDVAFGAGAWVAVGENGAVLRSIRLCAPWALNVECTAGGSVIQSPARLLYDDGEQVTITAVPDSMHVFGGWGGDVAGESPTIQVTMNTNKFVKANFVRKFGYVLTVTTLGQGAVAIVPAKPQYNPGEVVEVTASPDAGWVFIDWSGALSGTNPVQSLTMDGDKTLAARFMASPVLTPVADQTVSELEKLRLSFIATDPDSPPEDLRYALVDAPAGATVDPASGVFEWTPSEAQGPGEYAVRVRVTDSGTPALSRESAFRVTVLEVNSPPVVSTLPTSLIGEGSLLVVRARATDTDLPEQTLTYSLIDAPAGVMIDHATGMITWTPSEEQGPGNYYVSVRVTDNGTPPLSSTNGFDVAVAEVNRAPTLDEVSDRVTNEQELLTFTATASDPDLPKQILTFALENAPAGALIDPATGVFRWTPTEEQGPGVYAITIRVTDDGNPPLNSTRAFTVTVAEVNKAPVLGGILDREINEGQLLAFSATATDEDLPKQSLVFALENAPAGATIDPTTGAFKWIPTEQQGPGVYEIIVKLTDNGAPALTESKLFTVSVSEVNQNPTLTPLADQSVDEGDVLLLSPKATDDDVPANKLTYGLGPGAPDGATVNPITGAFYWRPSESHGSGHYDITLRVLDDGTPPLDDSITFAVDVREVNRAPVLASIARQSVSVGETLRVTATASDDDLPANRLSYELSGTLLPGAEIDPVTGVFTWTPTLEFASTTQHVTIRVTDDGEPPLSDSVVFEIVVGEARDIQLTAMKSHLGEFRLYVASSPGRTLFVEASSDLEEWTLVATLVGTGQLVEVVDPDGIGRERRFYRVVSP